MNKNTNHVNSDSVTENVKILSSKKVIVHNKRTTNGYNFYF